jgi:hypothetical protein
MGIDSFERLRVMSFDCYGTLIDREPGILSPLRVVLASRRSSPAGIPRVAQSLFRGIVSGGAAGLATPDAPVPDLVTLARV